MKKRSFISNVIEKTRTGTISFLQIDRHDQKQKDVVNLSLLNWDIYCWWYILLLTPTVSLIIHQNTWYFIHRLAKSKASNYIHIVFFFNLVFWRHNWKSVIQSIQELKRITINTKIDIIFPSYGTSTILYYSPILSVKMPHQSLGKNKLQWSVSANVENHQVQIYIALCI